MTDQKRKARQDEKIQNKKMKSEASIENKPVVTPKSLSPTDVKARNGFNNTIHLLSFVTIVCDGDMKEMTKTVTFLTWFEEWFSYFEYIYGRTVTTITSVAAMYQTNKVSMSVNIRSKIDLVL